jgi:Acyl-protein synthetase, LuxE
MTSGLSNFAARLRELICHLPFAIPASRFNELALKLFALQFEHNLAYRKICEARGLTPKVVEYWTQIPFVPTVAFKELELTSLAPHERTVVFHSSGTTEQKPSRHFHNVESLAVYEASLLKWFRSNVMNGAPGTAPASLPSGDALAGAVPGVPSARQYQLILLTPAPELVPHSSLAHMLEIVRQQLGAAESAFVGQLALDGSWTLDFNKTLVALGNNLKSEIQNPKLILGTAFSFVHLLDYLVENNLRFKLPEGSRIMETGGYKNRSRTMPKTELYTLITERLGVARENIICEYGMSELSSQAYSVRNDECAMTKRDLAVGLQSTSQHFHFPPWARAQIVSPENGREVATGETGLIRVFDLANVFSVAAVQTEDLAIRRGDGFELKGRAQLAEPRGCSLMTA